MHLRISDHLDLTICSSETGSSVAPHTGRRHALHHKQHQQTDHTDGKADVQIVCCVREISSFSVHVPEEKSFACHCCCATATGDGTDAYPASIPSRTGTCGWSRQSISNQSVRACVLPYISSVLPHRTNTLQYGVFSSRKNCGLLLYEEQN